MLDPVSLAALTSAITLVGQDYAKGIASEAGKATWERIKSLFGWHAEPPLAAIPERVAAGITASPEIAEELLKLLKQAPSQAAASLVQNVTITGGKVVMAQNIETLNM
jgi:CHASE3 domain sensor protein